MNTVHESGSKLTGFKRFYFLGLSAKMVIRHAKYGAVVILPELDTSYVCQLKPKCKKVRCTIFKLYNILVCMDLN